MFNIEDGSESLEIYKDIEANLRDEVLAIMAVEIKDRFVDQILSGLAPQNFFGEASDYLSDHSIPYTKELQLEIATRILDEIKQNIDSLIYLDGDNSIVVNQAIADFEFGTYYKPVFKIFTKTLEISSRKNMQ